MKKLLLTYLLFAFSTIGNAQDLHLSQFFSSDQFLNPAMMGAHTGDLRVIANYRNQWRQINGAPLTTGMLQADKAFHYYSHEIDGGIMYARDQFSGFQTITNKIYLAGAYGYDWLSSHWRGGIQLGVVSNSTDLSTQTFPTQWDYPNGTFSQDIYNGEENIRASQMYVDLNLGTSWKKKFNKFNLLAGVAIHHINRPKDTYFSQVFERRKMRGVFHSEAEIKLNADWQLEPKIMWMWTARAQEYLFGSNVRYSTANNLIPFVYFGVFYRHGIKRTFDAVYPVFGVIYKEFDLGLSYDINLSPLSKGIKRVKTFEASLKYTVPTSKVKYKIIPCDRY
ncbi:MAG: PorP/SprF family type IX secretion system membrane protein [Crocinitomicaceae bacterium]